MVDLGRVGFERGPRRRHAISEKRRIVELTFRPGASVAQVAQVNGVNANQVFSWRRAFQRGELGGSGPASTALLPVVVSSACEVPEETRESAVEEPPSPTGAIHIEFPGRASISVEHGADGALLRTILESLRR